MKKEKAIELIKKVLGKTQKNNNEHEVEVAMLKAQELMVKYGIASTEVDMTEVKKKELKEDEICDYDKKHWSNRKLARIIADNFKCEHFIRYNKKAEKFVFIGLKEDVEIAKEVFTYAKDNMLYLTKRYLKQLKFKTVSEMPDVEYPSSYFTDAEKNYLFGFLEGLEQKFKEQIEKNNWGLILIKDDAVIEAYKNKELKQGRKSASLNISVCSEHYSKGFEDGLSFTQSKNQLKESV